MRVLIDTTYVLRAPQSGTGVYLERLCAELERRSDVDLHQTANERRRPPAGGGLGSVNNLLADRWWLAAELPRRARAVGADLIHHPLPARARAAGTPQVITVQDLAVERLPGHFDRRFRTYARRAHRAAARAASAVICISETTAADARSVWGIEQGRIVVATLGPGQELRSRSTDQPRKHFLYVGDAEPRKNLRLLLDAYASYRRANDDARELVLAGSASTSAPGIRVEGRPTADRLAELYAGAVALVHPSLYEGFGLTPLEAMSFGTPVIAVRSPAVLEVCADAARYVDPHDADGLAAAMATLVGSEALQHELSDQGRKRAAEFSWAASARAHVAAYSLALTA